MCRVPDPIRWQTEQTRIDFLEAEVQTCSIALDMARFEYERGHIAFASREVEKCAERHRRHREVLAHGAERAAS